MYKKVERLLIHRGGSVQRFGRCERAQQMLFDVSGTAVEFNLNWSMSWVARECQKKMIVFFCFFFGFVASDFRVFNRFFLVFPEWASNDGWGGLQAEKQY